MNSALWSLFPLTLFALCAAKCDAQPHITYRLRVADFSARTFQVNIQTYSRSRHIFFQIPAWSPGYYQILNYYKNIQSASATDSQGAQLPVSTVNPSTWMVHLKTPGPVDFQYQVKATDSGLGFFGAFLDKQTGYINGPSTFMYILGRKADPVALEVSLPAGWKLATGLRPTGNNRYTAANYDQMVDCPLQLGHFKRVDFEVDGIPFAFIAVGNVKFNAQATTQLLSRIAAAAIRLFGNAPFHRYLFIYHGTLQGFGGGLEHHDCTVLSFIPDIQDNLNMLGPLVAHEYFHAWNVKYIHPAVLGPFDYTRPDRTHSIWFCEGVTDYYAYVLLRMAHFITPAQFLQTMASRIRALRLDPARRRVSLAEASWKSWEGGSMGYGGLSYYLKGSLVGFLFDIEIRYVTQDRESLNDVMRFFDDQYGRFHLGYDDGAIERVINLTAGADLSADYQNYVDGTGHIPWSHILSEAGLKLEYRKSERPLLGISTTPEKKNGVEQLMVNDVMSDSAAEKMGIKPNDWIEDVNGKPVSGSGNFLLPVHLKAGDPIRLTIIRSGKRLMLQGKVGRQGTTQVRIVPESNITPMQARIRKGLLRDGS